MAAGWTGSGLAGAYTNGLGSPVEALIQQFVQGFGAPSQMSLLNGLCAIAGFCGVLQGLAPGVTNATELPTVDLDYVLQKPTFLNTQYDIYVFQDIRYAASPTGNNRFRAPQTPITNRTSVQSGGEGRACAQASPKWQAIPAQFVAKYDAGQSQFSLSDFQNGTVNTTPSSRETEDCLFLDVYTPRSVLNKAGEGNGAPVTVQIYGGGFIAGVKDLNPAGLVERDRETGGDGVIIVSLNYRLGVFGWLAGDALQSDGDANAGLLDQQFALHWVQKYIHKFGGNANDVTVIGESAGGSSIMHQITSYGGNNGSLAFQKAIIQSPGFFPVDSTTQTATTASSFLQYLGVSSLAEARTASFENVYAINGGTIDDAPYGSFVYGPAVDGTFVPALPGVLLANNQFHKDVQVMVGHNADEGIGFTSPYVNSDTSFASFIGSKMSPSKATTANLGYIANTLYPVQNYPDQINRTSTAIAEMIFTCNTFYLDTAFNNQTYSYLFAVPPAYHGSDVAFTYYTGATAQGLLDPQVAVAIAMQKYFLNFARSGNPNGDGLAKWEEFGSGANMLVFNTSSIVTRVDDTANKRCRFWQENL